MLKGKVFAEHNYNYEKNLRIVQNGKPVKLTSKSRKNYGPEPEMS